ncbi:MAG: antibiotic biosynthesis monooxygenase [Cyanobacteriota bacterium]|nr:antibiotic biosynthesis monooxygenase [Cyanobacteriota bacterium]
MLQISTHNEVSAIIELFSCQPERQPELIDTSIEFARVAAQQPGFVAIAIHKSLDGLKVATYAQWQSQKDYETFINSPEQQALAAKFSDFPAPDSHLYEVVSSDSKVDTPKISQGEYLVHFAEFRLQPENQPRMVELAKQHVGSAMELPGLISANFHRSLDGTRVINYGQWRDRETIEELRQQPGFGSESPYWEGLAENEFHLYEVVFVESKTIDFLQKSGSGQ